MGHKRGLLWCCLLCCMGLAARPAQARFGYGYGYGYGPMYPPMYPMMPMTPYYPTFVVPEHLEVNNQYFDLSLGGIERLCAAVPELCAAPEQQARLDSLDTHRSVGTALLIAGVAAAVAGPVWTLASIRSDRLNPNWTPLAIGVAAGIGLPLAASFVAPRRADVVDFINDTNRRHPEAPVRITVGTAPPPPRSPGVVLGRNR